jgi:hypothetical protein
MSVTQHEGQIDPIAYDGASPVASAEGDLAPSAGREADDGLAQRILEHYIAPTPIGGSAAPGDDPPVDGGPAAPGQRAVTSKEGERQRQPDKENVHQCS